MVYLQKDPSKMIKANNPNLKSWISVSTDSDFPIQNIPFGVFKSNSGHSFAVSRIGDKGINIAALSNLGYLSETGTSPANFSQETLNDFLKLGRQTWRSVRNRISELFEESNTELQANSDHKREVLFELNSGELLLPVSIGDYTDFYASKEHATNVGTMFRGKENALMPNWLHLPVGYHGRASSIVVSGTPVRRPKGQQIPADATQPIFGASKLVDFELEMGYVMGEGKPLGERITTAEASDYIFGLALFNDWSARDIQKWEYVPLGPFLGKSFASTLSPWLVSLDALEPFRVPAPKPEKEVLPYLKYEGDLSVDINLEVYIQPEGGEESLVCQSNFKYMYWTMEQQVAHHTVNGCNLRAGDLLASGTISGPSPDSYGSMLELSWRGSKPLTLKDGSTRKFIQDGDTVIMRGYAKNDKVRIGFGEVRAKVLPAID